VAGGVGGRQGAGGGAGAGRSLEDAGRQALQQEREAAARLAGELHEVKKREGLSGGKPGLAWHSPAGQGLLAPMVESGKVTALALENAQLKGNLDEADAKMAGLEARLKTKEKEFVRRRAAC